MRKMDKITKLLLAAIAAGLILNALPRAKATEEVECEDMSSVKSMLDDVKSTVDDVYTKVRHICDKVDC
jgi:hypothetical protein